MSLKRYLDRIKRLDYLISSKSTGNPDKLASKLKISKRSVFNLIDDMKFLGMPVKYSRSRESYYYETEGKLFIKFLNNEEFEQISEVEMEKSEGGFLNMFYPSPECKIDSLSFSMFENAMSFFMLDHIVSGYRKAF